jgi:hypothetical protein
MPVKPKIDPESSAMNQLVFWMSLLEVSMRFVQSIGIGLFVMLPQATNTSGTPAEKTSGVENAELTGGSQLELSLKQAVDLALAPQGNVRVQLAEELVRQAQARSAQSRAALLPNIESFVSQQNRTVNLAAFGIQIVIPIPGFVSQEECTLSGADASGVLRPAGEHEGLGRRVWNSGRGRVWERLACVGGGSFLGEP